MGICLVCGQQYMIVGGKVVMMHSTLRLVRLDASSINYNIYHFRNIINGSVKSIASIVRATNASMTLSCLNHEICRLLLVDLNWCIGI